MSTASRFEGILDRYFEEFLAQNPAAANVAGLPEGEGKLGRTGLAFLEKEERRRRKALEALDAVNPRELTGEQQLDRLAFQARLHHETEDHARGRAGLEPSAVEEVLNLLLHELIRGDDEPARAAKNLRALLRQIPGYLEEAITLLQKPEAVWRRTMDQSAGGAASLLDALRQFLGRQEVGTADAARIDSAAKAIERYRTRVMALEAAPANSFSLGPERLQRRVRDELGLDYSLGQIEALANGEVERIGRLLAEECARHGAKATVESVIAEARAAWSPGEDLVEVYRRETDRVAEGFRRARAVSFPAGETLQVRPVPDFMRALFPTAAYSQPGAFEEKQRGIFWVNDLSVTKTSEAEKQAERAQHFGLALTCAHEAYPGHHLQFVSSNRHPRRWRRLYAHAVFYEGWTLWCEQMMTDLGVDKSPWLRLQQLHDALWRCHRILVDLRLQTGRYSWEQGVRHMMRHLAFTRARAEADVNWYTAQPGVPMSYWLGRLENERLHRRLVQGRGWSLRKFNDWLLGFGTIPQGWIEKYGLD